MTATISLLAAAALAAAALAGYLLGYGRGRESGLEHAWRCIGVRARQAAESDPAVVRLRQDLERRHVLTQLRVKLEALEEQMR